MNKKYKTITPLEIINLLCNHMTNGYRESSLAQLEHKFNLTLPYSLRQFLLGAGKECICAGMKAIFSLDFFQKQGDYFIIGEAAGQGLLGILMDTMSEKNPPLYIKTRKNTWDFFVETIDMWLITELDRRIRKAKQAEYMDYPMKRYFCCTNLLCQELVHYMEPSRYSISPENNKLFSEDEYKEYNWEIQGDLVEHKKELKDFLLVERIALPDAWYSVAICMEEKTKILYSARFSPKEQHFISFMQINYPKTAFTEDPNLSIASSYVEKLLYGLAENVHNPVLSYGLTKKMLLPKQVRSLADQELHTWLASIIGDFLKLFEKNKSWKLGIYISDNFVECYHLGKQVMGESLEDLWISHHLIAEPPLWTPTYTKAENGEEAPKNLTPFLKELIYKVHNYNLLNRYAFLARKIVTPDGFSSLTAHYTEEERFAFLSFYRELADGVIETIFDCLEKKIFSIYIDDRDFIELCENPTAHMGGWMRQYSRESLDFLDAGHWQA